LIRLVFQPLHIDKESDQLKPTALSDAKDKGLSVDRARYRRVEDSLAAGVEQATKANEAGRTHRVVAGTFRLSAGVVRQIRIETTQAFSVYDTALELNDAHADVCQAVAGDRAWRSMRAQLLELADRTFARP
jgi:hypothetical protein